MTRTYSVEDVLEEQRTDGGTLARAPPPRYTSTFVGQ